jgi:hypothetical protein
VNALAHYSLTASIIASVIGAVVLSLVVVRFGFTSPFDAQSAITVRRVLLTRLGHAVAAVCLAISAVLGILALSANRPVRAGTPPAVAARGAEDPAALDARVTALETALERVNGGITAVLTRLDQLERGRR